MVDIETVRRVAHLSRLEVTDHDLPKIAAEMSEIVDWMDKLNELETAGVEALIHIGLEVNQLREDISMPTLGTAEALANVPAKDTDYIRVPKVM